MPQSSKPCVAAPPSVKLLRAPPCHQNSQPPVGVMHGRYGHLAAHLCSSRLVPGEAKWPFQASVLTNTAASGIVRC